MSKIIVFSRADGGTSIVVPVLQSGETEEQALVRCQARDVPVGTSCLILESSDLPPRRWRSAWRSRSGQLVIAIEAARQMRRQELLSQRDAMLQRLREAVEQAEDDGDTARLTRLRQRRRQLRVLEATLDGQLAVAGLDELERLAPVELKADI
jgi:hypothetical protein